jgi:antitoxin CptB
MTGTTLSTSTLDPRRKRLLYRCWHRGTREMDLIVGRFADAHLVGFAEAELDEFERLIEVPDPDLYAALTGARPLPEVEQGALFRKMKAFHESGRALP